MLIADVGVMQQSKHFRVTNKLDKLCTFIENITPFMSKVLSMKTSLLLYHIQTIHRFNIWD